MDNLITVTYKKGKSLQSDLKRPQCGVLLSEILINSV